MGWREKGNLRDPRLIHGFLATLSLGPITIQSAPTIETKMPKNDTNQCWKCNSEPLSYPVIPGISMKIFKVQTMECLNHS